MNNQNISCLVWNGFKNAITGFQTSKEAPEPRYSRIINSHHHNLIVVEIDQDQVKRFPEGFFDTPEARNALQAHSTCSKVDVVDLGTSLFFYYWLRPITNKKHLPSKVLNPQPDLDALRVV